MRTTLRTMVLAGVLAIGGMGWIGTSSASAHDPFGGGYGGYGDGYGGAGGYSGYGGYNPGYSYYGNGGHDFSPHWHTTTTPYGSFNWYGNGAHDFQAHAHTNSPYGGYVGYSGGPGYMTQSYYAPAPTYQFMPW